MVRMVRTAFVLLMAAVVGLAVAACRDIDEPPPIPVLDPNAPVDGGTDGGLAGSFVFPCAQSFAS
jgi:hypothetical protein